MSLSSFEMDMRQHHVRRWNLLTPLPPSPPPSIQAATTPTSIRVLARAKDIPNHDLVCTAVGNGHLCVLSFFVSFVVLSTNKVFPRYKPLLTTATHPMPIQECPLNDDHDTMWAQLTATVVCAAGMFFFFGFRLLFSSTNQVFFFFLWDINSGLMLCNPLPTSTNTQTPSGPRNGQVMDKEHGWR